jgi:hypothetical protein
MITLYLDMDGVVADFHKAYHKLDSSGQFDRKKFRSAVLDYEIFKDLDPMPNGSVLLRHVASLRDVKIEMLTSMGTFDAVQGAAARKQKLEWLRKHSIPYPANFVRTKSEKAKYATPHSILIDDSIGCITPFEAAGGHAILHEDSRVRETLHALDGIILQIRAIDSLRNIA